MIDWLILKLFSLDLWFICVIYNNLDYYLSATVTQEKFDATLLHSMPNIAANQRMVDDGTGQVQVNNLHIFQFI